jgi:hypothetical protein
VEDLEMMNWQALKNWLVSADPLSEPVHIELRDGQPFCEEWALETPIFRLPTGDDWTLADACQGVLVLGATGSGKSSGSADALALKMLHLGTGGLVLCVKVGEADYWQEIAALTGRTNDLIRVTEKEHGFNVFDYELRRCGRGAGLTLNLVNLFRQLQDLVEAGNGKKVGPDFWERACARCISNAIHLQAALTDPFTLQAVRRIVSSSPRTMDQARSDHWQTNTDCSFACAEGLEHASDDYEVVEAVNYFTLDVPAMGDKQRAGIFETWEGLADPLLRTPLRQKFCETTTWTPEDAIERGKIILLDLPVKEFEFAGKMAGVIAKFMFQKAIERRPSAGERSRRPCFIWADEFENFTTSYDNLFQKTARSSKGCTVYIGQNLPGILSCLGGQSGEPFMKALLGNLTTHIYHSNAEEQTNRFAADTIGRDWQERRSISMGESQSHLAPMLGGSTSANTSLTEQLEHIVLPREFTRMRTGGQRNRRIVDAILFQASRTFSDGNNYCPVYFIQRFKHISSSALAQTLRLI